jgi:hypothetical protein
MSITFPGRAIASRLIALHLEAPMIAIGGLDRVVVEMREVVANPDAIALGRFSKTLAPRCAL